MGGAADAVEHRAADAAIMNKLQAHYVASEACGVHVVPGIELDTKPYALPVQKGWIADYAQFNRWLVELVMDGTVDRLSAKWFRGIGACRQAKSAKLDLDNFYGIGWLSLMGLVSALAILGGQIMYKKKYGIDVVGT